jgi:hypothetical protein
VSVLLRRRRRIGVFGRLHRLLHFQTISRNYQRIHGKIFSLMMERQFEALGKKVLKHGSELRFGRVGRHGGFYIEPCGGEPIGARDLKIFYVVSIHDETFQSDQGVMNPAWIIGAGASRRADCDSVGRPRRAWFDRCCVEGLANP